MTALCTAPIANSNVSSSHAQDDFRMMFNQDRYLVEKLQQYCARHAFACALETGTHKAETTVGLSRLFPKVYTVEVDINYFLASKAALAGRENVVARLGNSPEVIGEILPELEYPLFAFLDAHWYDYWPLKDELMLLLSVRKPKLIMIHDFRVPGRNFGFDGYQGRPCDLDFIGDVLPHGECKYVFNDRTAAGSANRGVLLIEHLLGD